MKEKKKFGEIRSCHVLAYPMNKKGPIIIIEDDHDDKNILEGIFKHLNYPNEVIFFHNGVDALEYLNDTNNKPFIILSDIYMPKLNGFKLRDTIHNNEDLRLRCIPYIFFTTEATQDSVINAYSKSGQGFFVKPTSTIELEAILKTIVEYWQRCTAPNYIP